ncbi:PspC domain-containing protein [Microbacterium sp. MAHUQ-60]|uniref:PspC domain-containing protein n=1 Tax=unclassified Microbacterium TaxID=2609290 RepID=UPI00360A193A
MSFPSAPPPFETEHPAPTRPSDRFFAWVAGLGIARSDGWIGGVAAGIAARLRIDPLIVRGVLVVATLFGLPMIFLYAVAWALLPDPEGRIHLRELLRGRFEPAQLGILAGLLVGMLTVAPLSGAFLFERLFSPYTYEYAVSGFGVFLFIVGLALVGILLVLIVRAARRTAGGDAPPTASEAQTPRLSAPVGSSGAAVDAESRTGDAGSGGAPPASSLVPEPAPADAEALEAWRAQHAAWQQQDQAWRHQQQDAEKAARDQARAERQATAAAFAAEAAERRRISRVSNPRASVAYIATVIGVALVAATAVWLWSQDPDAATAGMALFTAALVLAFGMIVAGVARRRSGFLAFLTAATLAAGLLTGGVASLGNVRFGEASISNLGGGTVRQPFGNTGIVLQNLQDRSSHPIDLHKGTGYTEIYVSEGVELRLSATVGDVRVDWSRMDTDTEGNSVGSTTDVFTGQHRTGERTVYRETVSSPWNPGTPGATQTLTVVPVTIDQETGWIRVVYSAPADKETEQ